MRRRLNPRHERPTYRFVLASDLFERAQAGFLQKPDQHHRIDHRGIRSLPEIRRHRMRGIAGHEHGRSRPQVEPYFPQLVVACAAPIRNGTKKPYDFLSERAPGIDPSFQAAGHDFFPSSDRDAAEDVGAPFRQGADSESPPVAAPYFPDSAVLGGAFGDDSQISLPDRSFMRRD